MKKRVLSLALALALSVGLAIPALAEFSANVGGGAEPVVEYAPGQPTEWNSPSTIALDGSPWMIGYQDGALIDCEMDEYGEATYTFRDGSAIQVVPDPDWDGDIFDLSYIGEAAEFFYFSSLWAEEEMQPITIQFDHGIVDPRTGEKVVSNVYDFTSGAEWEDPDYGSVGSNLYFHVKIASAAAYPSAQTVEVDGEAVEFQMYAIKDADGNDTNYIKLRDLADILTGTAAGFDVGWNGDVTITTGQPYTKNGTEQTTPFSGERAYRGFDGSTLVNGEEWGLSAIVLTDDNGGGYTYYKLRDLGAALGFTVDWSAERGVYIETK